MKHQIEDESEGAMRVSKTLEYNPAGDNELREGWDAEVTRLWYDGWQLADDEPTAVDDDGTERYELVLRMYAQ